jgi:hypothetical protein
MSAARGDWKELYQAALVETDPLKLSACIEEALVAVLDRLRDLDNFEDSSSEELTGLEEALHTLRRLQRVVA